MGAGALALLATVVLVAWPRTRWDRRLVMLAAAMIYSSYMLTYSARVVLIRGGRWSEPELLYKFAARYHVLPIVGLAAMVAALLASWPLVHRCDSRRGLPAIVGTIVGLLMLTVQRGEATHWNWMLRQPGQRETLSALHHLGTIARSEGVTRSQLLRIFDPAVRAWNESLLHDRPQAFHLMNLTVQAPDHVEHPLADGEARSRLLAQLKQEEIVMLGSGTCASLRPVQPGVSARTIANSRLVEIHEASEREDGRIRMSNGRSYIEFEFDSTPEAPYLLLPGLIADQDVVVSWCDAASHWRPGLNLRWLRSDRHESPAVIDLDRVIHWPSNSVSRLRIKLARPGEIALQGPPRLLR